MKAYWLSCNTALSFDFVVGVLNGSQAIETWVSPYPGSAIVISRLSLNELTAVFHSHLQEIWFVLIEISNANTNGWLPGEFWDHINDPASAWRKKVFGGIFAGINQPKKTGLPPPKNSLLDWLAKGKDEDSGRES